MNLQSGCRVMLSLLVVEVEVSGKREVVSRTKVSILGETEIWDLDLYYKLIREKEGNESSIKWSKGSL